MSAHAELSAVSTTLGELAQRITNILAELTPAEEERYAADLMEVERTLKAAHRRLQRSVAVR